MRKKCGGILPKKKNVEGILGLPCSIYVTRQMLPVELNAFFLCPSLYQHFVINDSLFKLTILILFYLLLFAVTRSITFCRRQFCSFLAYCIPFIVLCKLLIFNWSLDLKSDLLVKRKESTYISEVVYHHHFFDRYHHHEFYVYFISLQISFGKKNYRM